MPCVTHGSHAINRHVDVLQLFAFGTITRCQSRSIYFSKPKLSAVCSCFSRRFPKLSAFQRPLTFNGFPLPSQLQNAPPIQPPPFHAIFAAQQAPSHTNSVCPPPYVFPNSQVCATSITSNSSASNSSMTTSSSSTTSSASSTHGVPQQSPDCAAMDTGEAATEACAVFPDGVPPPPPIVTAMECPVDATHCRYVLSRFGNMYYHKHVNICKELMLAMEFMTKVRLN